MGHIWPKFGSDRYGKSYGPYYVYYVNLIWATALHIKPIDVSLFRSVVYWYCLLLVLSIVYWNDYIFRTKGPYSMLPSIRTLQFKIAITFLC